jgi:peptide deformylase
MGVLAMIEINGKEVFTLQDIIKDSDPHLRDECLPVEFPMSDADLKVVDDMINHVEGGENEALVEEGFFVPSSGIAAPQIGAHLRIVMCRLYYDEFVGVDEETGEDEYEMYTEDVVMINPTIIARSENLTYLEDGESCLSVPCQVKGYVHRNYKIIVKFFDTEGQQHQETYIGLNAIIVQHELDHLDGVLYYDHISKENPMNVPSNSKPI